ncbi:hypothetical protein KC218_20715, partial [Mycobacterium tuberculosis]|nr:hypothetical protein [Mycobacterium tuberculosis]
MVMVGWAAHQGLKPLRTLTRQVEARDSADLDPVQSVEHAEVKPLVEALNGLFARVRRGIEADRRFFADAAHELRTPLNSSLILAKLLADNKDGTLTEEQVKYARAILSSNNDLLALINDILDLSRIEAGHVELSDEVVVVDSALQR